MLAQFRLSATLQGSAKHDSLHPGAHGEAPRQHPSHHHTGMPLQCCWSGEHLTRMVFIGFSERRWAARGGRIDTGARPPWQHSLCAMHAVQRPHYPVCVCMLVMRCNSRYISAQKIVPEHATAGKPNAECASLAIHGYVCAVFVYFHGLLIGYRPIGDRSDLTAT